MNLQETLKRLLLSAEVLEKCNLGHVQTILVNNIIEGLKELIEKHEPQICIRCGYEMRGIPENFNQGICPHTFVPEKELRVFAA
jgi:Zn ribbon nucleic-acid-binding protein